MERKLSMPPTAATIALSQPAAPVDSSVVRGTLAGWLLVCLVAVLCSWLWATPARAQNGPIHYPQSSRHPVGSIGRGQLARGGPLPGYFQPVAIYGPDGSQISVVEQGQFTPPEPGPVTVGMLIGHAYRLRVTGIPQREGEEVYPTIEVINRLYPPPHQKWQFPIPIVLTTEELDMALTGSYVVRVIYLEDPNQALPVAETPGEQRYYELASSEDPLLVADRLGKPVAILRIGSRVPDLHQPTGRFLHHTPPLQRAPLLLPQPADVPGSPAPAAPAPGVVPEPVPGIEQPAGAPGNDPLTRGLERGLNGRAFPRVPVGPRASSLPGLNR